MRILVVAPHADDEVLGVGGTMARLSSEGHEVIVAVLTGHGTEGPHPLWPREGWDEVRNEARQAHEILGVKETLFEELPAVLVPDQPLWKLNKITLDILNDVRPDVLFIPFPFDLHRDHRELAYSFSVGWRPSNDAGRNIQRVCAYETVSETHWGFPYLEQSFVPNEWVNIDRHLEKKVDALRCYQSQIREFPDARSVGAVEALAHWRGSQVHFAAAEAFVVIRQIS